MTFLTGSLTIVSIAELRSQKYPLKASPWHSMNPASAYERREVIEMVYNALTSNSVPAGDGTLGYSPAT